MVGEIGSREFVDDVIFSIFVLLFVLISDLFRNGGSEGLECFGGFDYDSCEIGGEMLVDLLKEINCEKYLLV